MSPSAKAATPAPTAEVATDDQAQGEAALHAVTAGFPDGEVTFTRPGVESLTFRVKDGKISTTKERQEWLLRHVAGTAPAAE